MALLKPNQMRYVAGDRLPALSGHVTEDDGSPTDITGWTISLNINYEDPLSVPVTITDATNGRYVVQWREGDLQAGEWTYEIQFLTAEGLPLTLNRHPENDRLLELLIDEQVA